MLRTRCSMSEISALAILSKMTTISQWDQMNSISMLGKKKMPDATHWEFTSPILLTMRGTSEKAVFGAVIYKDSEVRVETNLIAKSCSWLPWWGLVKESASWIMKRRIYLNLLKPFLSQSLDKILKYHKKMCTHLLRKNFKLRL